MDEQSATRRIRPQFSLLTSLLLMTIVGLTIVTAQLWFEIGPLRAEVRMLRDEVGRLSIGDESKLHAIAVRTNDDLTWKWRVWVPAGQQVTLHSQWGNVPPKGVPTHHNLVALEPGEHWITLTAKRGPDGKHWEETLATSGGSVGGIIQPDEHWFDWRGYTSTGDGVSTTTYVAPDSAKIIVLSRRRVGQVKSSVELNQSDKPTPGFIVWLRRR